ncbi:glycoside hydrolase family 125 protein [Variovorax paradoxus]|nr:glycoside hydrolase family 125 protein [Variovorax paradoxus]
MKKSDLHLLAAVVFVAPHLSAWMAWPMAIVMALCACLSSSEG